MVGSIGDDYETGDEVDDTMEVGEEDLLLPPVAQSPAEVPSKTKKGKLGRSPIANLERSFYEDESNADDTNTPPSYLKEIKAQQAHIARLQKSLREANHKTRKLAMELHKEHNKQHDEGTNEGENKGKDHSGSVTNCPRCNSSLTPQRPHAGTWDMHPDCKEFMKLDDHLKENLRNEKEKRLNEVKSQMKFILDTDDIKDSYGKWSCCGKDEYEADCAE